MQGEKGIILLAAAGLIAAAAAGCNGKRHDVMTSDPRVARAQALGALHRAAADSDKFTRAKAIEAMVGVLGPEAGQVYISALGDAGPNVRFAAAVAVGDLKYAPALPRLLDMARYKQPRAERQITVYCGVIYALHRLGRTEHTPQLAGFLSHRGAVVRANAAMVMGRMGVPSAARPLRAMYNDEQDPAAKLQAMESLARVGDLRALAELESCVCQPSLLDEKLVALRAMGELGSDRTVRVLRDVVRSPYEPPQARVMAAGSMARLGTVTDFGYDLCLTSAGEPGGVMAAAVGGNYDPNTVDPMMLTTLQRLAVISLGWMKRTGAVDVLVDLLDSEDGGVRVAAAMSILRLLPKPDNGAAGP